jgi:hypothetical protein
VQQLRGNRAALDFHPGKQRVCRPRAVPREEDAAHQRRERDGIESAGITESAELNSKSQKRDGSPQRSLP